MRVSGGRPRQKPSGWDVGLEFFQLLINNDDSIYVGNFSKVPTLRNVPRASSSGSFHTKRTEFFLSEGLVGSVQSYEEAGSWAISKDTFRKLNTEPFIRKG